MFNVIILAAFAFQKSKLSHWRMILLLTKQYFLQAF